MTANQSIERTASGALRAPAASAHLQRYALSMPRDLDAMLAAVHDEETFLKFVAALGADFGEEREIEASKPSSPYGPGAHGWENGTIDAFLEASAAWGASTAEHPRQNDASSNPWQRCAHILYAGKFYE